MPTRVSTRTLKAQRWAQKPEFRPFLIGIFWRFFGPLGFRGRRVRIRGPFYAQAQGGAAGAARRSFSAQNGRFQGLLEAASKNGLRIRTQRPRKPPIPLQTRIFFLDRKHEKTQGYSLPIFLDYFTKFLRMSPNSVYRGLSPRGIHIRRQNCRKVHSSLAATRKALGVAISGHLETQDPKTDSKIEFRAPENLTSRKRTAKFPLELTENRNFRFAPSTFVC